MKIRLFICVGCWLMSTVNQAKTFIYGGEYYSNNIDVIDVTDLTLNVISSMTATSDFGVVEGIYGFALNPITREMYVVYQSGSAASRRLGLLDQVTGQISDIGESGNIIDIAFDSNGELFGTTGSFSSDYSLHLIDTVTASTTFLVEHFQSTYGGGMTYNRFTDEIYYQNNNGTSVFDLSTFVETVGSPTGSPGETQAMIILTPTLGWMAHYGTLYTFDPQTEVFTPGESLNNYHAFEFAAKYFVGGTVSGLLPGNSLVLQINNGGDLTISDDGAFTFAAPLSATESFSVAVITQPNSPIQPCAVSNGTDTITSQDIADVLVSCEPGDDLIFRDGF